MLVNDESLAGMNGTRNNSTAKRSSSSLKLKLVLQEARSVSAWMAVSTLFRALIYTLIQLHSLGREDGCGGNQCESRLAASVFANLSLLAGWILGAFPRKVASNAAPGFMYANPWLLMKMESMFGSIPNVPLRITEAVLGRLTVQELLVLLPIHFACAISTMVALRKLLSEDYYPLAFEPIAYSVKGSWLLALTREALVTCIFCVAFLALPQLFAVNKLPKWSCILLLYPIYNMTIDSNGMGSTFGPNVLYALSALSISPETSIILTQTLAQLVGSISGGVLGGLVMQRFFPDDAQV